MILESARHETDTGGMECSGVRRCVLAWGLGIGALAGCQSKERAASDPGSAWIKPVVNGGESRAAVTAGELRVGDPAPALTVDAWVQGKPVTGFSKFRVHAIAFWSPASGPSVESLAHLTHVQRGCEDVIVVGVVATERPPEAGETDDRLARLRAYAASHGEELGFRVAFDGTRAMRDTWLLAAGQTGIPCVFLVGHDGKVAWIGHPDDMDAPLAAALRAGRGWIWSLKD
jgi:hypothetical protein